MSTTVVTKAADGSDEQVVTTNNTIDQAGRRTAVAISNGHGEQQTEQSWDNAGNLTHDRHGTSTAYNPDHKPTTIAGDDDASISTIGYWADGSRKTLTTTGGDGAEQTTTFHYTPGG
ncbi:hypothetical protein, partial [Kitasatospora sp. MBT63]|uniref:hypothetical protein n=1 Tax=Kitasatospora sp. MBT63 TaxID=1444768 RepID=UPI0011EA6EB1